MKTALFSTLVTLAAAAPGWTDSSSPSCGLTYDKALALVEGFGSLLTAFQESTALTLLSPTFTDTSSSINFLSSNPAMNGPTFPTRDAFIAGQGSQPPIGFEVLGIDAVSCLADPAHSPSGTATGVVVFRWLAEVGGRQTGGSKGINVLYVKEASGEGEGVGGWVIETVFSEFNSAVWVKEFGGDCKAPSPPPSPASGKGRLFRA